MAKKIKVKISIDSVNKLITSREQTRTGFITLALEKNYLAVPYIEEAKALKSLSSRVKKPKELLDIKDLRVGLLTASGLSEKSLNYLNEDDRTLAIKGLIEKFLEPAGENFVDELVYRYLLTKGDALGGKARNLAGVLGERKFLRSLLAVFNLSGIDYQWKDDETNVWLPKPQDDTGIEKRIKGLYWTKNNHKRLLIMNIMIPVVKKNVDLSILDGAITDLGRGKESIIHNANSYIALGELKGGIDPAGADEHWKTANSALDRIRKGFGKRKKFPLTFFIGAAIENSMAAEIFRQLQSGTLNNAANLTNDEQLTSICEWIINL
ncbi:MAG: restriction endonuclease [Ignavibacteria bacterium RIFOXYB2_FULL_35_12]|nr:MAG: restriction endonuclease [Ignavibacteria bacterium GWA2_36_19]OGU57398.1 MAG: restriction endonuclease [Ignavibacteria bacterium GWF2_35_20]OGU88335.1 MAG: restriction endonuclease [Ignavibacteria bacterium RIFOXYC12_FULL_35_11]OGU91594.1 MAG: restriction endonuclease [Ignavibacteria bacterium RIFOXYA12_FULL_35_25]OGU97862.1 MAG: restriction endonuclease [Ignavibacteria bacterium RIFOXYB12_FULL_35_14]OGU98566.1 MAG: restriction endonuclease [Ignavibacteria bacterium RIFOXYC2_FULL_35_16